MYIIKKKKKIGGILFKFSLMNFFKELLGVQKK